MPQVQPSISASMEAHWCNWECWQTSWSESDRGRECEKSPAVCSARDFHPLSSAGRNMCLCFILFCASSALSSLSSAAPALLALADGAPNYSREGANKYWGEGLKLPPLSDDMLSLEVQI